MENNAVGRVANLINEEIGDTLTEEEVAEFRAQQEESVEFEDNTVVGDDLAQTYPSEEGVTTPETVETETTEIKEDIIGVNTDAPIRDAATEYARINDVTTDIPADVPVNSEDTEVTNEVPNDVPVDTPPIIEDNTDDVVEDVIEGNEEVIEEEVKEETPIVIDEEETVPPVDTPAETIEEETKPVEEPVVIDDKPITPEVIEDVATSNVEELPVDDDKVEVVEETKEVEDQPVVDQQQPVEDTRPVIEEPAVIEDVATTPKEEEVTQGEEEVIEEPVVEEDVATSIDGTVEEEIVDDTEVTDTETIEDGEEVVLTEAQIKIHQLEAICSEQNINATGNDMNTPILTAALRILHSVYSDNKVITDIDDFNLELLSNEGSNTESVARLTFMIKGMSITQILVNRYGKLLYVGGLLDDIKDGISKEAYDFDNAIRSITGVPSTEGLYEPYLYVSGSESGLKYFNITISNNYINYKKVIEDLTKEISKIEEVAEGVLPAVIINDQKEYDTLVFERTINIINPATGFNEDAEFLITKEIKPLDKITGREVSLTIEKLEETTTDIFVSNTYKSIVYHEFLVL